MDNAASDARAEISDDRGLVVSLIPALRAFARTFYRDVDSADDLVQETLTKAIANIEKYETGTHMKSWLFTIMRNAFYSRYKKERREQTGLLEDAADRLHTEAAQEWALQRGEIKAAIERLPPHQREVLVLIGVLGVSYEETARICNCAIGTVKSRLNRAREALLIDIGEDSSASAVTQRRVLSDRHFIDHGVSF